MQPQECRVYHGQLIARTSSIHEKMTLSGVMVANIINISMSRQVQREVSSEQPVWYVVIAFSLCVDWETNSTEVLFSTMLHLRRRGVRPTLLMDPIDGLNTCSMWHGQSID